MSPRRKSTVLHKKRTVVRSVNRRIIVHGVQRDEPDFKHLARVVVQLAKDMRTTEALGICVDEVHRLRFPDTSDD